MTSARPFNYPVWTITVQRGAAGGPSLQEQVFVQLRRLIVNGQFARGARLPASRILAEDLAISRNTINMAYDRLAAEGYLKRRPGSGFYVEERLPEEPVQSRGGRVSSVTPHPVALSKRGLEAAARHWSWSRQDRYDLSPGMPAFDNSPYRQFGKIAGTRLLDWVQMSGGWIFEDDFNSEIRWSGTSMVPLVARDGGGRGIHVSC